MAIAGDGIRVWVNDDQLIINQWKGQAATTLVNLDHAPRYGTRTVQVEDFDAEAEATAIVNWTAEK